MPFSLSGSSGGGGEAWVPEEAQGHIAEGEGQRPLPAGLGEGFPGKIRTEPRWVWGPQGRTVWWCTHVAAPS